MKYLRFIAAVSLPFALTACGRYGGPEGGWGHMMPYGYGGMGIMWILFLIIIGVVLYAVIQGTRSSGKSDRPAESPLDILKRRYARGEVTKEQFEQMKKDLGL